MKEVSIGVLEKCLSRKKQTTDFLYKGQEDFLAYFKNL